MSATHLVVVPNGKTGAAPESLSQRIRRLQAEARAMAHEHVEVLRLSIAETARLAAEIADGGEAYPVGARELARRLAESAPHQSQTLAAINDRAMN
jgi:hypothetical protein